MGLYVKYDGRIYSVQRSAITRKNYKCPICKKEIPLGFENLYVLFSGRKQVHVCATHGFEKWFHMPLYLCLEQADPFSIHSADNRELVKILDRIYKTNHQKEEIFFMRRNEILPFDKINAIQFTPMSIVIDMAGEVSGRRVSLNRLQKASFIGNPRPEEQEILDLIHLQMENFTERRQDFVSISNPEDLIEVERIYFDSDKEIEKNVLKLNTVYANE